MPCPPDARISGNSSISSYGEGSGQALANAIAAVPAAAYGNALDACNCPSSCPFPSPYGINFGITKTSVSWSLWNVVGGFVFKIFGDGWIYKATAEYRWWGTSRCVDRFEQVQYELAVSRTPPPAPGE